MERVLVRRGTGKEIFLMDPSLFKLHLSEEYKVFEKTGKTGFGDTSTVIGTGRIVRDTSEQGEIPIPADLLERAKRAYAACTNSLRGSPALVQYGCERTAAGG